MARLAKKLFTSSANQLAVTWLEIGKQYSWGHNRTSRQIDRVRPITFTKSFCSDLFREPHYNLSNFTWRLDGVIIAFWMSQDTAISVGNAIYETQRNTAASGLFPAKNYFMARNECISRLDILSKIKPSVDGRKWIFFEELNSLARKTEWSLVISRFEWRLSPVSHFL